MGLIRNKDISNIAKNIKQYRLKEGLNQKDFASLLEMNYQNYSKMERGVYTPSLDKLLEICSILCITPNDLLLEGRDFDDYKEEIFEGLDASVVDIVGTMRIVEEQRAKAILAKESGDKKQERIELDFIIQMFAWTNDDWWKIADYLYHEKVQKQLINASNKTLKKLVDALRETKK